MPILDNKYKIGQTVRGYVLNYRKWEAVGDITHIEQNEETGHLEYGIRGVPLMLREIDIHEVLTEAEAHSRCDELNNQTSEG